MAFSRIYYDNYKNRIYCVDVTDGKRSKVDFHPTFEYYVYDKTGKSDITDIYGKPVSLMTSETKKDMKMVASSVPCCESDFPDDVKYLQKTYQHQDLKVNIKDIQVATIDIEIQTNGLEFPHPEDAAFPINLISVHYSKEDTLYTFGNQPYTGNHVSVKHFHYCVDEKTMIEKFIKHFRSKKVDIITGWYCRTFDIPYIIRRCENLKIDLSLSPINICKKKHWQGYHIDEGDNYEIAGISILDGVDIFKNYEKEKRVSYSLQNIGMEVVGEGKKDYSGSINDAWKINWNEFVEYNVQDVLLVRKIETDEKNGKKYIELTINLCYQALIPFQRVFSSISLVEGYILKYVHENKMVLQDQEKNKEVKKLPGAFVFAKTGYHKYCMSWDAESLYPYQILQQNISPETLKMNDDRYGKTPFSEYKQWETADGEIEIGGIYYDRSKKGILAQVIEKILSDRKINKKKMFIADAIEKNRDLSKYDKDLVDQVKLENESSSYYDSQQYVRKILANSIFGCASNEYFHLYNYNNAISITMGGQSLIKYMKNNFNKYMKEQFHKIVPTLFPEFKKEFKPLINDVVIQCDTDSLFVTLEEVINNLEISFKSNQELYDWMNDIDLRFFSNFIEKILQIYAKRFGMEQIINFKREKIIKQKLTTAKKKYVDEILANEDKLFIESPKISVTGIEIVRTDTPSFCKSKLKNAVNELFLNQCANKIAMNSYIRSIKEQFIKTDVKEISIPKGVNEYTKYAKDTDYYIINGLSYPISCPIHVRAAINYNYLIEKWKLPLIPVGNGTKIKYIHISSNNELNQDIIGFVNEWPDEFNVFKIDYDKQFTRTFTSVFQRFYDVLNWGNIEIEENTLSDFIEF